METVVLLVVVVGILAFYGFMDSFAKGARIANKEVDHLVDVHDISIEERTSKLLSRISDNTMRDAAEVRAKLKIMRNGQWTNSQTQVVSEQ